MKIRVREAKQRDKGLFRKLWKSYLKDQHKKGSDILPTAANLDKFELIFEKYVSGEFEGIVLFVADDAVLMWGSQGEPAFETNYKKPATAWGTYVGEKLRGKGVSKELRKIAAQKLREKGFDVAIGIGLKGNEEGLDSGTKFGFDLYASLGRLRLDDEE